MQVWQFYKWTGNLMVVVVTISTYSVLFSSPPTVFASVILKNVDARAWSVARFYKTDPRMRVTILVGTTTPEYYWVLTLGAAYPVATKLRMRVTSESSSEYGTQFHASWAALWLPLLVAETIAGCKNKWGSYWFVYCVALRNFVCVVIDWHWTRTNYV